MRSRTRRRRCLGRGTLLTDPGRTEFSMNGWHAKATVRRCSGVRQSGWNGSCLPLLGVSPRQAGDFRPLTVDTGKTAWIIDEFGARLAAAWLIGRSCFIGAGEVGLRLWPHSLRLAAACSGDAMPPADHRRAAERGESNATDQTARSAP